MRIEEGQKALESLHYINMPMQYTAIFTAVKDDNFQ